MKSLPACVLFALGLVTGCGRADFQSVDAKGSHFNTAGAPTVEFRVPDMMCAEGCGTKVKEILSEQPGVKEVLVEFDTKTATVAVDKGVFDDQAALAALVDHQFTNSALKPASSEPPADD